MNHLSVLLLCFCIFHLQGYSANANHKRFEDGEHRYAANNGTISVPDPILLASGTVLFKNITVTDYTFTNLMNTTLYTYGDIVGFAGDFFGPVNELSIICTASSQAEARNLFYKAFIQMWNTTDAKYIARIRAEMKREVDAVFAQNNTPPYEVFAKLPETRWASVFPSNLELGLLLTNNLDHFSSCAVVAYYAGHLFAMQTAAQAGTQLAACNRTNVTCVQTAMYTMQTAYAMNAFADHYLTDLFASGHVRTPRRLITMTCFPDSSYVTSFLGASSSGGLASQWMHDEDNRNGLLVTNKRGDIWWSYGDDNYFSPNNTQNRIIIDEAVQLSRDEVYNAFLGANFTFGALSLIPDSAQLDQFAINNTCPLFFSDPNNYGAVMIRQIDQIRPDAWLAEHNMTGNPNQNNCNYTLFTYDQCPHAILSKIESTLPAWVATAYTQKMVYSDIYEAWINQRPDHMSYSVKPIVVFAIAGVILAWIMSISFLFFECFYGGFGRCKPSVPQKVWPMSFITCCFGRGGWQLGWIFSTALFPALITSFLGVILFEIVFITMPDIYYAVPVEAWIAFFVLGFVVAFFLRYFFYNWYNYFRARRDGKDWMKSMRGHREEIEDGTVTPTKAPNDPVDDEFTPLTK